MFMRVVDIIGTWCPTSLTSAAHFYFELVRSGAARVGGVRSTKFFYNLRQLLILLLDHIHRDPNFLHQGSSMATDHSNYDPLVSCSVDLTSADLSLRNSGS